MSPSSSPRVRPASTSVPPDGSDMPHEKISSPDTRPGRKRRCCSGDAAVSSSRAVMATRIQSAARDGKRRASSITTRSESPTAPPDPPSSSGTPRPWTPMSARRAPHVPRERAGLVELPHALLGEMAGEEVGGHPAQLQSLGAGQHLRQQGHGHRHTQVGSGRARHPGSMAKSPAATPLVEVLQKLVGGELDLLVVPLRSPGRGTRSSPSGATCGSRRRRRRSGPSSRPWRPASARGAKRRSRPSCGSSGTRSCSAARGLHVGPAASDPVLTGVDQLLRLLDACWVDLVLRHRASLPAAARATPEGAGCTRWVSTSLVAVSARVSKRSGDQR